MKQRAIMYYPPSTMEIISSTFTLLGDDLPSFDKSIENDNQLTAMVDEHDNRLPYCESENESVFSPTLKEDIEAVKMITNIDDKIELTRRDSYKRILNALTGTEKELEDASVNSTIITQSGNNMSVINNPIQSVLIYAGTTSAANVMASSSVLSSSPSSSSGTSPSQIMQYPAHDWSDGIGQYNRQYFPGKPFQNKSKVLVHSTTNSTTPELAKRQMRLEKNREAARECRRKKKQYIAVLEDRIKVLQNLNKNLMSELNDLKDMYCKRNSE